MNYAIPVDLDADVLSDFCDELDVAQKDIENLAITLEQFPNNTALLAELRDWFQYLLNTSYKLELSALSESLHDTIRCLDKLIKWRTYPSRMSEFLLILVDRVYILGREVAYSKQLDIQKTQTLVISLQPLLLSVYPEELPQALENAMGLIMHAVVENSCASKGGDDVLFFDDEPAIENNKVEPIIIISKACENPLFHARELIQVFNQRESLCVLASIGDASSKHGDSHSQCIGALCLAVNKMVGEPLDPEALYLSACLHDIALAAIPQILLKTEKLSEEEYYQIKQHPTQGAILAMQLFRNSDSEEIVLHHHERLNGSGYPYGLKGTQISEGGRLLGIVDSFHAMIHHRPFKKHTKSVLRAMADINANSGNLYDDAWVKPFNQCIREYWLPEQRQQSNSQIKVCV